MSDTPDYFNIPCLSDECNKEMNKHRKVLNSRILKLHEAVSESLMLTDFNIRERAMLAGTIAHGWITTLFAEQAVLRKLEDRKEELEEQYMQQHGKRDIPKYITSAEMSKSDALVKIEDKIDEQSEIVRYLTETVRIIKTGQWDIKNSINILQLEN